MGVYRSARTIRVLITGYLDWASLRLTNSWMGKEFTTMIASRIFSLRDRCVYLVNLNKKTLSQQSIITCLIQMPRTKLVGHTFIVRWFVCSWHM